MRYTSRKVQAARAKLVEMERRIVNQQRIVAEIQAKGYLATQAQTQLMIMEQSLVELRRFFEKLQSLTDLAVPQSPTSESQVGSSSESRSEPFSSDGVNSSEIDVLEAAEAVILQHGDRAPLFCARKMVDMLERGDLPRVATWLAIRHAARALLER